MAGPAAGTPREPAVKQKVPREILAEASVWVSRLHGPDRSAEMERDFRAWQARSPVHRLAFERCTDAWINVGKIKVATAYDTVAAKNAARSGGGRQGARWWAAGAVSAGLLGVALFVGQNWWAQGAFRTEIGEQRAVILDDGSRMLLNTETEVRVSFDDRQRTVNVHGGEALFEVARELKRPFVVRVSGSEVVAVGTAFSVRYASPAASASRELTVTLIEGQVNVRRAAEVSADAVAPGKAVSMRAGERLRLGQGEGSAGAVPARVDRPNVDQVTAWKRNEAVFDATTLRDAVAEMNRYSRTKIVLLDGLNESGLRVSGLYRTGDNAGFAQAVAHLHGLKVRADGGRLELEKPQ
ncbi:FecR family protein [Roseateles sp. LYH14W]|uniref:FecR family protein n=1 Tax=Pelomonas parva TaxID=3299032 RepID=A0ABW7F8C4_9BURK